MSCSFIESNIPFVINVEVPCGFVIPESQTTLTKDLFLDSHCVYCLKTCEVQQAFINGSDVTCDINVDAYKLVGALHYDMRFNGFVRVENAGKPNPSDLAPVTKGQSLCINSLIAYNCAPTCSENSSCTICERYSFTPEYTTAMLYTEGQLSGVPMYTDINNADTLTTAAISGLKETDGCKTIVITGSIRIHETITV